MQKKDKIKSKSLKSSAPLKGHMKIGVHYAYILRCADDTFYTGATNNLEKRLVQHNTSKQGAHYTKIRRPVVLVHSETFETLAESRKREAALKRLSRKEKMVLINLDQSKPGDV